MTRFSLAALFVCLGAGPAFSQHDHGAHHESGAQPKPPQVFLDKSPRVVAYQLKRLDDARLLMVKRKTTDEKYAPVYEAILKRPGVSSKDRAAALAGLVELNGSNAVEELLEALKPLSDADRGERRTAERLTELLLAEPKSALTARVGELHAATFAENRPLRLAGHAGLTAIGEVSDALLPRYEGGAADYLAAVPLVPSPQIRAAQRATVLRLMDAGPEELREPAIRALAAIPAEQAETFGRLVPLLRDESLRPAVVRTLLTVPAEDRDPALSGEAIRTLVDQAEATPAADRTGEEFLNAMQLADELLARLPVDEAKALRTRLREIAVRVVRIRTVEEEMRYDTPYFAVEAGRPVQVLLENVDLMPHNLVVTAPGELRNVAEQGMQVGPAGGATGKAYVPDGEAVLFATDLVDARAAARLTFTAPSEPGEYPYVCTFPRHWMRMYGVMVVVPDLDAWRANPTEPADPIGNTRSFVQAWTVDDLLPPETNVDAKLVGRVPEIGRKLFVEAGCAQCHRADSTDRLVGPSLVGVFDRWKGDSRKVLREMLDPSAHVEPKYAVRQVITQDGRVLTGLVVAEDDESISLLADPEAKTPQKIVKTDVLESVQSDVSLMPKALLDQYTEDEIFELLAYLRSLEAPPADR